MGNPTSKYDQILTGIESLYGQQTFLLEKLELIDRHHKTLYGNGNAGLCETVRGHDKDIKSDHELITNTKTAVDNLKEVITLSKKGQDNISEAITFKWLVEKILIPILWPLLVMGAGAYYIAQTVLR